MKKKILALMLAAVMSISFTACTGSGTKSASKKETVEKEEVKEENNLSGFVGKPLTEAMEKIKEFGYTAKYIADGVDFTEFIDSVKEDYVVGDLKEDPKNKTVEISLELASEGNEIESTLAEKLEEGAAWISANDYGKSQFGEGFDLNYLAGKITASAEDENTWFLKAECTVDGNKMTCEAKVTGTTDNPEVTSVDVY